MEPDLFRLSRKSQQLTRRLVGEPGLGPGLPAPKAGALTLTRYSVAGRDFQEALPLRAKYPASLTSLPWREPLSSAPRESNPVSPESRSGRLPSSSKLIPVCPHSTSVEPTSYVTTMTRRAGFEPAPLVVLTPGITRRAQVRSPGVEPGLSPIRTEQIAVFPEPDSRGCAANLH